MSLPSVRPGTVAKAAVLAGLLLTIATGLALGLALALLVFGGSVLVAVIALFWSSVRNLSGDTPLTLDEALGLGAPTAAEEQKRSVLRALKDLEFERSVGKISEQDYLEFSARYRAEARRLIERADESSAPAHELAQKLVTARLVEAGLAEAPPEPEKPAESAPDAAAGAADANGAGAAESDEPESSPEAAPAPQLRTCDECATKNDLDARFCKGCGAELGKKVSRAQAVSADGSTEETP